VTGLCDHGNVPSVSIKARVSLPAGRPSASQGNALHSEVGYFVADCSKTRACG
jgi:hypothetical protein